MRPTLALCCLLALAVVAQEPLVLSPQEGDNAPALRQALDTLRQQKGGVLLLNAGTYGIGAQLALDGLGNVQIVGRGGVILKLLPERHTRTTQPGKTGDTKLFVQQPDAFAPGLAIELQGAVRKALTPSGKPHQIPYINNTVKEVHPDHLVLAKSLTADIPAAAAVIHPMNIFDGRHDIRNVTLQGLTFDLNRDAWPVRPLNHTRHSGILLHGPYSYEKGLVGAPLEGIRIVDCTVRNAHHRGIAFYAVRHSGVYDCRIENTGAEGIDFDHFVTHCQAVGNTLVNCQNIELNDASDCLVQGNTLRGCRTGIVVWQWCQLPDLNERNLILRNAFENCPAPAISLRTGADHNTVLGNTGQFAKGPTLVVDGKGNLVGPNAFAVDQGPVQRIAPENVTEE
jgi:hypothetical protein